MEWALNPIRVVGYSRGIHAIIEPVDMSCCSTINKIPETEIEVQPENQKSKAVKPLEKCSSINTRQPQTKQPNPLLHPIFYSL